jgi:hypothetical protein
VADIPRIPRYGKSTSRPAIHCQHNPTKKISRKSNPTMHKTKIPLSHSPSPQIFPSPYSPFPHFSRTSISKSITPHGTKILLPHPLPHQPQTQHKIQTQIPPPPFRPEIPSPAFSLHPICHLFRQATHSHSLPSRLSLSVEIFQTRGTKFRVV